MAVGIEVGTSIDEIGTTDFLHAFLSTVSGRLETLWGARFPMLMRLCEGGLDPEQAPKALAELLVIRSELRKFAPDLVIWDIDDRAKPPPWGVNISSHITDLSNYFVTASGRDLITVFWEALQAARDEHKPAVIVSY